MGWFTLLQSRRNWSCSNFLLKAFELFTICKDMLSICFDTLIWSLMPMVPKKPVLRISGSMVSQNQLAKSLALGFLEQKIR